MPVAVSPTSSPSAAPSSPPSTAPTLQPTALVCSLALLTPYAQRSSSPTPVVNPGQGLLSVHATCNVAALQGVWSSTNASLASAISETTTTTSSRSRPRQKEESVVQPALTD